ncbi:MBL fold metallo-hydrolase [Acinetobacter sp. V89_4]|uniref:MBL fold metallo-hydrolase n=1 Tax=Acinetobacter sp. V89_4 TaxID=3044232 RepID=UPI00249EFFF5|nr:MBL fold metallo-hydrolase [Acinetobacter sp. V89_4]MDI3452892.1 MBL fold metallo-hydrolase [Acinetobacter sp. V89_4]
MKKRIWIPTLIGCLTGASYIATTPKPLNYSASDHFNEKQQIFFNRQKLEEVVSFSDGISVVWDMLRNEKNRAPAQALPMKIPNWDTFLNKNAENQFIWLGHSNLLMRVGGQTIAIDPVFGDTVAPMGIMMHRFQKAPVQVDEFPSVDLVIISHNHYDHLEQQTIEYFAQHSPATKFIVPLGLATTLESWGISAQQITELDWWQQHQFKNVRITATEAQHASGRGMRDSNRSLWAGWVIQDQKQTIFYSGDNGYGPHYAEVGKRYPQIDIAFIENGQYDIRWAATHMSPEQTAQAAKDVGTKHFVPVHWGAYSMALHHWNEPVLKSIPLVQSYGINTLTPIMGEVFNIKSKTSEWYKSIQ